jgi:hypothetical protein
MVKASVPVLLVIALLSLIGCGSSSGGASPQEETKLHEIMSRPPSLKGMAGQRGQGNGHRTTGQPPAVGN